jgi:hypothetical protein
MVSMHITPQLKAHDHTFRASSGSHSANNWNRAHSMHWIRFFWFCWESLVEKVRAEMPGQSRRRSRSSRRRLVRKSVKLDGPVGDTMVHISLSLIFW